MAGVAQKLRARQRPPVPARVDLTGLRHPTETPANALAHRQLNNALAIAARAHARGRLLDVGCGEKPYAPLFRDLVDEHVGVDHPESIHPLRAVDVLATAYDIPLEDASFDTVLMTEVLEHLEEPARAIAEARRLLRTGGKLILSTPFMWPLHEEPRDFFRYSPHGLRHLLQGFEPVTITPVAGVDDAGDVRELRGRLVPRRPVAGPDRCVRTDRAVGRGPARRAALAAGL